MAEHENPFYDSYGCPKSHAAFCPRCHWTDAEKLSPRRGIPGYKGAIRKARRIEAERNSKLSPKLEALVRKIEEDFAAVRKPEGKESKNG